jgi:Skp family chaperone for outer membrane proteins
MRLWVLLAAMSILLSPALFLAQSVAHESENPKVCVAMVANASTVSASLERLTERLAKNLKRSKVEAVAMDSSTAMERKLRPTRRNTEEADDKQAITHC